MQLPSENRRKEIQELCLENLTKLKIDEENFQNGLDFYKYMFTNFPDVRVYFKDAQKYEADDVQKSELFKKQGQQILLALHMTVLIYLNKMVFDAYIREQINRHVQFKMDPSLWKTFWRVWTGYLSTKMTVSEEQKKAWFELGDEFADVAHAHLKKLGLPY